MGLLLAWLSEKPALMNEVKQRRHHNLMVALGKCLTVIGPQEESPSRWIDGLTLERDIQ